LRKARVRLGLVVELRVDVKFEGCPIFTVIDNEECAAEWILQVQVAHRVPMVVPQFGLPQHLAIERFVVLVFKASKIKVNSMLDLPQRLHRRIQAFQRLLVAADAL